jgi:hypothetical protein
MLGETKLQIVLTNGDTHYVTNPQLQIILVINIDYQHVKINRDIKQMRS